MMENLDMPIHLKVTLSIKEAAVYSNIGINKIESMLRKSNCTFVLFVETKSSSNVRILRNFSEKS